MCISPIRIKNPNLSTAPSGRRYIDYNSVGRFKDCSNQFIEVPCGVCPDCVRSRQSAFVQRCNLMFSDHFCFFGTLTYNDEMLPRITTSSGDTISYADTRDFALVVKRLRKWGQLPPDTKFLYVTEFGGKRHRPHFHFLMFIPMLDKKNLSKAQLEAYCSIEEKKYYDLFKNNWCRNVGTNKFPLYKPLFTFKERWRNHKRESNYEFHWVKPFRLTPDKEQTPLNVSFYVTKYVLKYDDYVKKRNQYLYSVLPAEEYYQLRRIINPRVITSKFFGYSDNYATTIRKGLEITLNSDTRVPWYFINEFDGKLYPLCKYLRDKFLSLKDWSDYSDIFSSPRGDLSFDMDDSYLQPGHFQADIHSIDKKVLDMNKICLSLRKNYIEYESDYF